MKKIFMLGVGGESAIKRYYCGFNKNFYIMESYVKRENQKQKKNNKNSFSKRFFLFTSSKGLHVLEKREMEKEAGGVDFPPNSSFHGPSGRPLSIGWTP